MTKTTKVWVYASRYKWQDSKEVNFGIVYHNPGDNFEDAEHQIIGEQEITYEVPDNYDFDVGVISALQKKKQLVMAEFQARITEIERQIQEHLAIPMQTTLKEEGLSEGDLF